MVGSNPLRKQTKFSLGILLKNTAFLFITVSTMSANFAQAASCNCCLGMGGIRYCDSSAGRFVCNNGYYSSCYCERHAVMDLQLLKGCCLWAGGVLTVSPEGGVVCRNGSVSELCSRQSTVEKISAW